MFRDVLILMIALLIAGCSQNSEISRLDSEIKTLKEENSKMEQRLTELDAKFMKAELEKILSRKDVAFLTIGDSGYSVVEYELGTLTFSIKNITSYASGTKVLLTIGNPSYVDLTGLSAEIDWGKIKEDGFPDLSSEKNKQVDFLKNVKAGSWTDTQIILDGIKSDELGYIRIKNVNNKSISLLTK